MKLRKLTPIEFAELVLDIKPTPLQMWILTMWNEIGYIGKEETTDKGFTGQAGEVED